ncbi:MULTISPECIES: GNAT family N-acetyltransferase [Vibrio]|uniref:N-acetyltransferase n=1 Tax=Vibrio aestuarianus TaxID=28171 RepID=A0A9X4FD98_9VIBR|nr:MULTISPECIES: GNAT family N-acetyltransferase [Vibrio]MDE1231681.1 N-acetyltransferase [Vibrio aestuarianus]MDE1236285.1 N-acetyltransferase [Vibrio aestuarianus]MDE1247183.1 N-acetyltransferase [Vibrio aestuarianus]MDE1316232.1 N-acetyltransferase [Vibrio aestuarianus]MDE1328885.1 N-acetyltransferase [Vibrio aestuarianus]
MSDKVQHDTPNHQYLVHLEGDFFAIVKYQQQGDVLFITSTRVPDELQGKGYGKIMMESVLPQIEASGYKVKPVCSYVVHYINRHEQWQHLLHDEG